MLSATKSSPSARKIAAIRRSKGIISGSGWNISPVSSWAGWGLAEIATTSLAAINPRTLCRNLARMASLSSSVYRSVLFSTNKERFPISAKARKGSYSERLRSLSTTNNSKSADVASSLASCSLSVPAMPASKIPGVSVIKILRSKPRKRIQ